MLDGTLSCGVSQLICNLTLALIIGSILYNLYFYLPVLYRILVVYPFLLIHIHAMFELRKSFQFEASHQLVHHDGKCANLHGHSYTLTVELRSSELIPTGCKRNMVTDFSDISSTVKNILKSHLDHHHLNDTLETDSPTGEYIAHWVYHRLKPHLTKLTAVEIRETATSSCTYRPVQPSPPMSMSLPHPHSSNRLYSNTNGSISGHVNGNLYGHANGNGNGHGISTTNGHSHSQHRHESEGNCANITISRAHAATNAATTER